MPARPQGRLHVLAQGMHQLAQGEPDVRPGLGNRYRFTYWTAIAANSGHGANTIRFLISYQGPDDPQDAHARIHPEESRDRHRAAACRWCQRLLLARGCAAGEEGAGANALPVSVTTPRASTLARTVVATGSINPWQEAIIGPEVGGYRVAAVNVDVGDKVRKGQELVRLSADMINAELASKRAAHRRRRRNSSTPARALRRAESLKGSGAVSAAEQERLESEELAARARVEAAEADREAAGLKLRYTRVLSPDDGVITSRTVVVGQIAQAGGEMLRLLRQNRMEWRAEVPEARLREVSVGKTVRVTTADGATLTGKVRAIAPDGPQRHAHGPRVRRSS